MRYRLGGGLMALGLDVPTDPLAQDLWVMVQAPKVLVQYGARDLMTTKLDGDLPIQVDYYHHTRRYGLLSDFESIVFSQKAEAHLRVDIYIELAQLGLPSPTKVVEKWNELLNLGDPDWAERVVRTYRNHKKASYPVLGAETEKTTTL
ncbi:hypothetical protein GCM10027275_25020 [Rhabdobacter roseus]|uniref:Uncharacterized protein n=1 Tax=Rhabdobacter roseus TaxID=1655419 RepID=A0A840TS98_9BACT|nr:hypothetical protein [Rhabdobacter roseus]MBB5284442.1 hypothetical protein [Rhabdobacter roseus]